MKNGFTLIELLAVIVILAIIALIATPIVLSIINDSKESATLRSAEFYVDAVDNAIMKENMKLGGSLNPNSCMVNENGNITCDGTPLEVEVDGEKPTGGNIKYKDGKVIDINLIFGDKNVSMSTNGELILGDKPPICILVSGNENEIGSKYQCKVKEDLEEGFENGYYFYVLSYNEDGTTNLIMDRNIYYDSTNDVGLVATETNKGLMGWTSNVNSPTNSYNPNSDGPVLAMTNLHNATKDWTNIRNIVIDYDESRDNQGTYGYGGIKTIGDITTITSKNGTTTATFENLKTRLPKYSEVYSTDKCGTDNGSCPLWLVNYLAPSEYITGDELVNISGIRGYWTLASVSFEYYTAMLIGCDGAIKKFYATNDNIVDFDELLAGTGFVDSSYGVRPVITIQL